MSSIWPALCTRTYTFRPSWVASAGGRSEMTPSELVCHVAPLSWVTDTASSPVPGSAPVTHQPLIVLASCGEVRSGCRAMVRTLPSPAVTTPIVPYVEVCTGTSETCAGWLDLSGKIGPRLYV